MRIDKLQKDINNNFPACLDKAFKDRFGIELKTTFDLIVGIISKREDGQIMTEQQMSFISGFSEGYLAALNQVR